MGGPAAGSQAQATPPSGRACPPAASCLLPDGTRCLPLAPTAPRSSWSAAWYLCLLACVSVARLLPPCVLPRSPGPYRAQFLLESVLDLKARLRGVGSDLLVALGKPEEVRAGSRLAGSWGQAAWGGARTRRAGWLQVRVRLAY